MKCSLLKNEERVCVVFRVPRFTRDLFFVQDETYEFDRTRNKPEHQFKTMLSAQKEKRSTINRALSLILVNISSGWFSKRSPQDGAKRTSVASTLRVAHLCLTAVDPQVAELPFDEWSSWIAEAESAPRTPALGPVRPSVRHLAVDQCLALNRCHIHSCSRHNRILHRGVDQ